MVPLGAFAVAIVAIVSGVAGEAQRQKLKAEQRMAMVARGMNADDIDKLLSKANDDSKPSERPDAEPCEYTQDRDRADLDRRGADSLFPGR